jgi:hypothetical protein
MVSRKSKAHKQLPIERSKRGSVTPFLAVSVVFMLATLGLAMDLMRDFEAHRQLQFAAQSVALFGAAQSSQIDGSYSLSTAQDNIVSAIVAASGGNWNIAQFGPVNNTWSKPVSFDASNVQFISNPADASEFFTQVTASRDGLDALQQFFLPAVFTSLNGQQAPQSVRSVSTHSTIEVIGQPASRVGSGAPATSIDQGIANFSGFASFPLAISNQQFATIANPSQTTLNYVIDFVSSTSSELRGAPAAGHLKGCLVNLCPATSTTSFYGSGQGDTAIDQLQGQLNYFGATATVQTIAPAVVERGSLLNAFDPADPTFLKRANEISQTLVQVPQKFYIIPVLANDPTFTGQNSVVGFARVSLGQTIFVAGEPSAINITIGESIPLRNASSAVGFATTQVTSGTLMPAPIFPFLPRQFDSASGGVSKRPRGIVLAPALSPRISNAS